MLDDRFIFALLQAGLSLRRPDASSQGLDNFQSGRKVRTAKSSAPCDKRGYLHTELVCRQVELLKCAFKRQCRRK